MKRIFTVGDIHGRPNIVSSGNWPEGKELTKEDVVIFLGDFGLYWNSPSDNEETYWLNWLAAKPYTVAFIDGNHENFDVIEALPIKSKWGGKVNINTRAQGDIIRLRRGEVYDINGFKIFTAGGALSIDKMYRTEGISWWPQETWTKDEEENALDNLDLHDWKVDYVLAHTCPDSIIPAFLDNPNSPKFNDPVARFLEFIDNRLEYKKWMFGHMHNDRAFNNGDFYQCHWKVIHELT